MAIILGVYIGVILYLNVRYWLTIYISYKDNNRRQKEYDELMAMYK